MAHGPDPMYVLRGSESAVTYLKYWSKDILYSGDQEGFIYAWDMTTKRQITKIGGHPGYSVLWIEFTSDDTMITQGRDGIVQFWSKKDSLWTRSDILRSSSYGYCSCCLVDNLIAIPGETISTVELTAYKTKHFIGQLQPDLSQKKYGMGMAIKAVESKSQVLIGYENGNIALWDVQTFKMLARENVHAESVMCLDYSSKLNLGFSGSADNKLKSWSINGECQIVCNNECMVTNPGLNDIVIRNDDKIVVSAGWDGNIRVFSRKKLKPLAVLSYHKDSIQCLTFSSDNILTCGSKDHHISLWEIYK